MNGKVPIRKLSDQLRLEETDCERVRRTLAFSLSRYADCVDSVAFGIDVTPFGNADEYRCELVATVSGGRQIHITTRGTSLDETVARAAVRASRSIDRAFLETRSA